MFKSTRHTLRAGRGLRSSLKKQRGGATLQTLCGWRDINPATVKWNSLLKETDFAFLLDGGWITQKTASEQYETIVEQQDKLFMLAMDAIYAELNADKMNEGDIMEKYATYPAKDTLTNYITDILYLVNLKDITGSGAKFDELLKTDKEPLLHLLLNPLRVQNHFIFNLASFIISLKQNPITDFNEEKAGLMTIRYDSLSKANTLNMTSTDLRDGPILTMPTKSVTTMLGTNKQDFKSSFWYKFLAYANNKKPDFTDIDMNAYTEGFNTWNSISDVYSILAAYIYSLYKNNGNMDKVMSLKAFNSKTISDSDELKFVNHLLYTIKNLTTPSEAQSSSQESTGPEA
jgi:hypothetical protein